MHLIYPKGCVEYLADYLLRIQAINSFLIRMEYAPEILLRHECNFQILLQFRLAFNENSGILRQTVDLHLYIIKL